MNRAILLLAPSIALLACSSGCRSADERTRNQPSENATSAASAPSAALDTDARAITLCENYCDKQAACHPPPGNPDVSQADRMRLLGFVAGCKSACSREHPSFKLTAEVSLQAAPCLSLPCADFDLCFEKVIQAHQ